MTNEEAKEIIIEERDSLKANPMLIVEDCLYDAFDVAIKAIEQQPCEDCISRKDVNVLVDELARAISDERCFMSRGRSTANIMQDILDLPTVTPQAEQKWIPCTERLPKTNDIYLVSMHSYGLPTRSIDGYIQQINRKWELYGNEVIAWMPLPEPYKAEKL